MQNLFNAGGAARRRIAIESAMFCLAAVLVAGSAVMAKARHSATPLVSIDYAATPAPTATTTNAPANIHAFIPQSDAHASAPARPGVRYFGARAVKPVRTVWMTVTAYSPDARSCGEFADGITASNKSIWTNAMKLVAADTSVLPIGTMLSIPGYDAGAIVPVLDRGGAIKGDRLDVLFPSHREALRWGVQRIPVTIWADAD